MFVIQKGATSNTIYIFIRGSATSPVGMGLTGLAYNTAGLNISYARSRTARTAISLVTQTVTGAFSSGGFVEVDGTNMPGLYRLDLPDAAVATGVDDVVITWKGANSIDDGVVISLTDYDPNSADADIAAIKAKTDNLPADPADDSDIDSQLSTIASYLDTEVAAIKAKTDLIPAAPAAVSDIPTANQNADALLDRANAIETGVTLRGVLRLIGSALAGKASGLATATAVFRNIGDTKDRITATVDADGNRTAVTTDLT